MKVFARLILRNCYSSFMQCLLNFIWEGFTSGHMCGSLFPSCNNGIATFYAIILTFVSHSSEKKVRIARFKQKKLQCVNLQLRVSKKSQLPFLFYCYIRF